MVFPLKPSLRHRACWDVDDPPELNPGLDRANWRRDYRGRYNRRNEPLDQPHNTPEVLQTGKIKAPADFFGPASDPLIVSGRFREFVERFEPGVHEFVPVRLMDKAGQDWAGDFYLMRLRWLAALVVARSDVRWEQVESGPWALRTISPFRMTFAKHRIAGHHLWQCYPEVTKHPYCSDAFHRACKDAGLRYFDWTNRPCIEVDDPDWDEAANTQPPRDAGGGESRERAR